LSATQRTRETGIRIVLGATVSDILVLFSRDFFRIIALSIVIACPIGYYAMHAWLEGFAYRIHVPFTAFIWSSALAVCIAMLTVCSQAFKAAQADPVRSLRSE
jgi:putative ABC transport system permease protein